MEIVLQVNIRPKDIILTASLLENDNYKHSGDSNFFIKISHLSLSLQRLKKNRSTLKVLNRLKIVNDIKHEAKLLNSIFFPELT